MYESSSLGISPPGPEALFPAATVARTFQILAQIKQRAVAWPADQTTGCGCALSLRGAAAAFNSSGWADWLPLTSAISVLV